MDTTDKEAFIHRTAQAGIDGARFAVQWSRHALSRLDDHGLDRNDVVAALVDGELIEDYSVVTRPLPDCLVLARLSNNQPIHVVIGLDQDHARILIITVYRPSPDRWKADWKTRIEV